MFAIVPIFIGVVFVMVFVGMITHTIMFGRVFGLVAKRISEAAEQQHQQQQLEQAAQSPQTCGYCGMTLPAGATECPNCGGGKTDRVGAG